VLGGSIGPCSRCLVVFTDLLPTLLPETRYLPEFGVEDVLELHWSRTTVRSDKLPASVQPEALGARASAASTLDTSASAGPVESSRHGHGP